MLCVEMRILTRPGVGYEVRSQESHEKQDTLTLGSAPGIFDMTFQHVEVFEVLLVKEESVTL